MATLLLCAVSPEHERSLARRLTLARRTSARHLPWWAELAAEGRHAPAAAVLAAMTTDRARELAKHQRDAAKDTARQQRDVERQQREAERIERERQEAAKAAAKAATRPPTWRYRPLPLAQSGVRRAWVLVATMGALLVQLWAVGALGDQLAAYHRSIRDLTASGGLNAIDGLSSARALRWYQGIEDLSGLFLLLLVVLPAAHVVNRSVVARGASRPAIRLYALAAAFVDLLTAWAFLAAAGFAVLVTEVAARSTVDGVTEPFGDEPWQLVLVLVPFGLVGVVLLVRSLWRLARAALGGLLTGPPMPAPPRVR
jgi:hypothetical protein